MFSAVGFSCRRRIIDRTFLCSSVGIKGRNLLEPKSTRKCSSSSSSGQDDDKRVTSKVAVIKKPDPEKKKAALSKLNELVATMQVTGAIGESTVKRVPLQLAKPKRRKQKEEFSAGEKKTAQSEMRPEQNEAQEKDVELAPQLIAAVKEAANVLDGDAQQTELELLSKLKEHVMLTKKGRDGGKSLSNDLIVGMKIEQSKEKAADAGRSAFSKLQALNEEAARTMQRHEQQDKQMQLPLKSSVEKMKRFRVKVDLYGSGSLNIFQEQGIKKCETSHDLPKLKTWDKLHNEYLESLVLHPPRNAFEEMITWTNKGKLWKFPIDNEQGFEEEKKVGFHEHVFLDHLLEDGFPPKGPIRHFMELVVTGLSKNPYITVKDKHEHVDWFRNYFKSKSTLLKELGASN